MPNAPKLTAILMASGRSTRFGSNKLLSAFQGRPLIDTIFDRFPAELFQRTVVVTRYAPVAISAAQRRFSVAENDDETGDPSITIRLGMEAADLGADGCLFLVCDQPLLRPESIRALTEAFAKEPGIYALSYQGTRGNPVLFPRKLFEELRGLAPGQSGGAVIEAHLPLLRLVEAKDPMELLDVDTPEALEKAVNYTVTAAVTK